MPASSPSDVTSALVHEGWNHLMSQRPLAAWGTWQRALRADPDSAAARQALETVEKAPELPLAARKVYRFRKPRTEAQRSRWERALRGVDLGEHAELAEVCERFGRLTAALGDDPEAWFNYGLCLAWTGQHRPAIACLEQVVSLEADANFNHAVEAWVLAEVLRQGGGAESLCDDLRYACTFPWKPDDTADLEAAFAEIRRIPTPRDPTRFEGDDGELEILEWLDRPMPAADSVRTEADLPRVLATIYITPGSLRLSSPRVDTLEEAEEKLRRLLGARAEKAQRMAAPLPLPFLDAEIWTARVPEGVDHAISGQLARETVEAYYENHWIHRPRQGLDNLSPLSAGQNARRGDAVARAKLEAVVRLREQLGSRPSAAALYQGYPFDRLRRRLGLEPGNPDAIDFQDLSCASAAELQSLVPEELDDPFLAEAFQSAAGLRDDPLASRFASELLRRPLERLRQVDLTAVFAPLIRQQMGQGNPQQALELLTQARDLGSELNRRSFDTWRAEILARTDQLEQAGRVYRDLIASAPDGSAAQVALDAAETLLDNGHRQEAKRFLVQALDLARAASVPWVENHARAILESC